MVECILTNKICSEQNKKCKVCKLDDCRYTIKIEEEYMNQKEKNQQLKLEANLKVDYKECVNCSMYKVLNLEKQILYCPYMLIKGCVLK